eukprot:TRINITY_DN1984_c0_g1_i2.p1 TRINITY_DN1984_c0_g1~~TRINITY_DN1984_c0_g1_i2.p1  ORF type:complete len:257 (+),score=34.45 TRINITY_DN1984_c0_g1_i2:346-1116(+)
MIEFKLDSMSPRCVAYDPVRQQFFAAGDTGFDRLMTDGSTVRQPHLGIPGVCSLGFDRRTGDCVVVALSDGPMSVHVLDQQYRETQPRAPLPMRSFVAAAAVRPDGRLFVASPFDGAFSVDPRSRETRRLLPMFSYVLSCVGADERDCLVIGHNYGVTTVDTEGRHVCTLPITNVLHLAISRDGILAVLRSTTEDESDSSSTDDDELFDSELLCFASNAVESPPLFRCALPVSWDGTAIEGIVWTDERLYVLVRKW